MNTRHWFLLLFSLSYLSCQKEFAAEENSSSSIRFYQNPSSFFVHKAKPTPDGGRIFVGETAANGFIYKHDAQGNEEWTRYSNGERDEYYWDVVACSDGGYITVGATKSPSKGAININFDGYATKYSSTGNVEWEYVISTTDRASFYTVLEMPDGSFMLAGTQFSTLSNIYRTWIVGLSSQGKQQFSRLFSIGPCFSIGLSLALDPDGKCLLAGISSLSCQQFEVVSYQTFLLKFTPNTGSIYWQKIYKQHTRGYKRTRIFPTMTLLAEQNKFVIGSSFEDASSYLTAQLLTTDLSGNLVHEQKYYGVGHFLFQQVQKSKHGGYLLLGGSVVGDSISADYEFVQASVLRVSEDGNKEWQSIFGGQSNNSLALVTQERESEIDVAGFFTTKNREQFHVFSFITDEKGVLKDEK